MRIENTSGQPDQPPDGQQAETALAERFRALLDGAPGAASLAGDLLERWAEPHRVYHTTSHLMAVLDDFRLVNGGAGSDEPAASFAADPVAVELAAWFHDAVYDPASPDNEEASARLAEEALAAAGCPSARVAETARLVRLTASHAPAADDTNGAALCDADLAVLAAGPDEYARYAAAVRREYHFVPDEAFQEGRAGVLRRLLGLPRLFHTPYGAEHWEGPARHNMRTELGLLTS